MMVKDKFKLQLFLRKEDDKLIYYLVLGLLVFSVFMVASASVGIASSQENAVGTNLFRQLIYIIVGYFAMMIATTRLKVHKSLGQGKRLYVLITIGISILLFATMFFPAVNGAKAWILLPFVSFQPSEFVKVYIIMYSSIYFPNFKNSSISGFEIIKKPFIIIGSWIVFIVVFQNDFGSAFVCVLLVMICCLMASGKTFKKLRIGMRLVFLGIFSVLCFLLTPLGISVVNFLPISEFQKARFVVAANPFKDIYGSAYQLYNSLIAFGKGGLLGVGYGESVQKFGYLPEARTDFLFPIIVEELGLIGILVVMVPYILIIYQMFYYAFKARNETYKIILVGTIAYLFIHFVLNIGGVSGLIPLTGVPLLLISSGGSSTVAIMFLIGISLNVIYQIKVEKE